MAGDWFPMGFWRSRCPEVVLIASRTGRDRHEVLGWLCDLWSWCSSETVDGRIEGVKVADLPSVLGADLPFWQAVESVLWLAEDEAGIVIPGWENWLCESAKKRAKERQKKRNQRSRKRPDPVPKVSPKCPRETGTTEQDRREEKKEEKTPSESCDVPPPGPVSAKKPRKHPDSPHHRCIALFLSAWQAKYGMPYPFNGGKDGDAVKAILGHLGGDEGKFAVVVGRFLADPDPFVVSKRHPLGILRAQLATWLVEPTLAAPTISPARLAYEAALAAEKAKQNPKPATDGGEGKAA